MAIPKATDWQDALDEKREEWLAEVAEFLATEPTGAEGDTAADRLKLARAAAEEAFGRDSDRLAATMPFSPDTMIGSYFRAPDQDDPNAEAAWLDGEACQTVEGCVIRQPFTSSTTAIYLVELYNTNGAGGVQRLVELDRMLAQRWAFYDSDAWLSQRRVSAREAAATAAALEEGEQA